MRSAVAITGEMDDMKRAADELSSGVLCSLPLPDRSCGIVFCDSEMDSRALMAGLKEKLQIPLVGCTTLACLDRQNGFQEMAATLIVLTADDVRFALSLSDPLTSQNAGEAIARAWRRGMEDLGEPVKLGIAFPASDNDIMMDEYPDAINNISDGVPLIGGISSFSPSYGVNRILFDGEAYSDRVVFLLFGGNVRPVFSVRNVLSELTEQTRIVTRAERNTIYTVENVTFVEYLRQMGLPVEKIASDPDAISFVTHPLLIRAADGENDDVPVARTLHALDLENGSGTTIGKVPEGSMISVALMKRRDIEISSDQAMRNLLREMETQRKDDYAWSTILCVSCVGRHLIMGSDRDVEGRIIVQSAPGYLNLCGFYANGELCPTALKNGRIVNRAHNESIVLCAF